LPYAYTYFRDSLTLDSRFGALLDTALGQVSTAGAVLIAARELTVAAGFTFTVSGRDLVFLADAFDGSQGAIVVQGSEGQQGQAVTVVCNRLLGLDTASRGGEGPVGRSGRPGKAGTPGRAGIGTKPGGPGGAGGPGSGGGPGGPGARGGTIQLFFADDSIDGGGKAVVKLSAPGGTGGAGGDGGPGGPGGAGGPGQPDGADGVDGPAGPVGEAGIIGQPGETTQAQISADEYWARAATLSDGWSEYRTTLGEYYFRAFNPSAAPNSAYLGLALRELEAAVRLDSANASAAASLANLTNDRTFLGIPRQADIIPDFRTYENIVATYQPLVGSLFTNATNLLTTELTLQQKKADLQSQLVHLLGLLGELDSEQRVAELDIATGQAEIQAADARLADIRRQLAAVDQAIRDKQENIGGAFLAFGASVLAVVGVATGAGGLVAAVPAVLDLTGSIQGSDATNLSDNKQAQADIKAAAGGFKDLAAGAGSLISFVKVIDDFLSFGDTSAENAKQAELLRQAADAAWQRRLADLHTQHAHAELDVVNAKKALAGADYARVQDQLAQLTDTTEKLESAAQTLIRTAQQYADILMKYAFLAARALEIYTLADLSNEIWFDYGYVNPEDEADLPLLQRITLYMQSWARFAGVVAYEDRFASYFSRGDIVHDSFFASITDAATLANFKVSQTLHLPVALSALLPGRFEAKAEGVAVRLTGATAATPAITCTVEHAGAFQELGLDATVADFALRPRRSDVLSTLSGGALAGGARGCGPIDLGYWGRGVAATWYVLIEPGVMRANGVDLSNLTAIEVRLDYQAFHGP
jgi:hypothetical protein